MMKAYMIILLAFLLDGVFSADVVPVSVMKGESVTLKSNVTKKHDDIMLWYFEDTRIAQINGHPNTTCLYDGEGGRFRDRLKVDYETGSLTITDIKSEHTGRYEAELIIIDSSGTSGRLNQNRPCNSKTITRKINSMGDTIKTFSVTVSAADPGMTNFQKDTNKPETDKSSGLSSAAVAGIVVGVLLVFAAAAAAGVIYYRHRITTKDAEMRKQQLL